MRWGIERTLARVDGMFAFALLERRSSRLLLARDRFGEKPLHYADAADGLVFASELQGMEAAELLTLTLSREALDAQYRGGYVPAPLSVYRECRKLEPGCWLEWRPGELARVHRYWSPAEQVLAARARPFTDEREAVDALEAALLASVRRRTVADVPVGAFLSGGIDSSTVVALMQSVSAAPVKTFSIGFDVPGYDEAEHARAVARHLGTDHHERVVTAEDALALVPRLGALFDEPFSDASQLPTRLVAAMARERVTVCLSGDGGDELFCGYKRYPGTVAMWRATRRLPARRAVAAVLGAAPVPLLDASLFFLRPLADRHSLPGGRVGPKLRKLAGWLGSASIEEFYLTTMGRNPRSATPVLGLAPGAGLQPLAPPGLDPLEMMMCEDIAHYLPGDILTKLDRATMSVGLEGRVPMLEPGVFDVAWRLPLDMKQRGSVGKWALREVLYRHVPRALIERPKMGFSAPVGDWLRSSLREWASDLLAPRAAPPPGALRREATSRRCCAPTCRGGRSGGTRSGAC